MPGLVSTRRGCEKSKWVARVCGFALLEHEQIVASLSGVNRTICDICVHISIRYELRLVVSNALAATKQERHYLVYHG